MMRRIFLTSLIMLSALLIPYVAAWSQANVLHPVKGKPLAADFALQDIDGKVHHLSDYRGKVVMVNFWATWCPPCRMELPSMEKLWQATRDRGVVLLAIDIGEDADTIFTFTADYSVSFPLLMDRDSSVIKKYPVLGVPTSFVIDPQGRLVYRAVGTREWNSKEIIHAILALYKTNISDR